MNKIVVVDDTIEKSNITNKIKLNIETFKGIFAITNIDINILSSTNLELEIIETEKKAKITMNIEDNCNAYIYIYEKNNDSKLQYKYILGKNSKLTIKKFKYGFGGKEMIETTLDKENSCFDYLLKSVCTKKEIYDYYIYHKAPKTFSSICNDIITLDKGSIQLQTSLFVPIGNDKCISKHSNNIINLNNKKSDVRPNFYIDQFDTSIESTTFIGIEKEEKIIDILLNNVNNNNMENKIIKTFKEEGGELYQ
jgi:Uncharacterized protein family (UPF0051).